MSSDSRSVSITPEQLLMLAGRLDDAPGFETPRERFRRFLTERVTDVQFARALVDEWQRSPGEQRQRALQDAVVMLGRFLGFEPTFGNYRPVAGAVRYDGQWRSRHRLHIVLEIRTDPAARPDLETLARSLAALSTITQIEPETRRAGLLVLSTLSASRFSFDEILAVEKTHPELRIVSTRALVNLAEMVSGGILKHDDVLKALTSASNLDFMIDLLVRVGAKGEDVKVINPMPEVVLPSMDEDEAGQRYWLAMILHDGAAEPEQIVELLISKRHILGISDIRHMVTPPRPDDWVCFFVPGTGVTGHGQIASLVEEDVRQVREADRFDRVLRLKSLDLYDRPVITVFEKEQRFLASFADGGARGTILAPISRHEFGELTSAGAAGARWQNALPAGSAKAH